MRNARKFDERITIGLVPDTEDLEQLRDLGYRTLVDLRDPDEKFGGVVERRAAGLGFKYASIPIHREEIRLGDVETFYRVMYGATEAPIYVFSRFGKKPLALLLLLEALAHGDPPHRIFQRARRFGLGGLDGDLSLQTFIVDTINSGKLKPVVEAIVRARPELAVKPTPAKSQTPAREGTNEDREDREVAKQVGSALLDALVGWDRTHDKEMLRERLSLLLRSLE